MSKEKTLYLVTGPIGAGKSSYLRCLADRFGLSSLEYICADIYYLLYFKDAAPTEGEAYAKAKEYCNYKLRKAVSQGHSFIWETVVAKEKKMDLIKSFLSQGYTLRCLYIGMDDYKISIKRVAQRHAQGWYNVPEHKTADRYHKSMEFLKELIQLAESAMVIDSSSDQGKIVMWKKNKTIQYLDTDCRWLPNLK
jgi:predicted ABC-type ATPase